jgi:D-alanine-D-alanine ligase
MSKLKVLVLIHDHLIPPDKHTKHELENAEWKTEYDVIMTCKDLGHEVKVLGVKGDLEVIRKCLEEFSPSIVFNLLEEFDGKLRFDQHIAAYLELKKVPYTGCNPRGLTLARDKALSKKILTYHRVPVPKFFVFLKNQKAKKNKNYTYPLIVKSLVAEGSLGIAQASIVHNYETLKERVQFIHKTMDTDAIAEQYIAGREFYVGVLGNNRIKILPVWELRLQDMPDSNRKFATEKVKWNVKYREKYGIRTAQAVELTEEEVKSIQAVCKKTYKALGLNGYARIDIRYTEDKKIYVLEANPNPGIAYGEEFPESAEEAGFEYEDMIAKILSLGISWYQFRK